MIIISVARMFILFFMAMCVMFCGFAKGLDFMEPVQRNICIWTCFIIGAGGGNGVESTVLLPFKFGKAASHVVVFAGPPQVTHVS